METLEGDFEIFIDIPLLAGEFDCLVVIVAEVDLIIFGSQFGGADVDSFDITGGACLAV